MGLKDRVEGYRRLNSTEESFESPEVRSRGGDNSCLWKMLSLILMLSTTILSVLGMYSWTSKRSSYEAGFDTDVHAATVAIRTEKVRFTGGLRYDENGTLFHADFDESTTYVGEPNARLDMRWQRLLKGHWITMENDPQIPPVEHHGAARRISGLDVYHQLHCLVRS
ncbi:hypothetical protein CLCR_05167 [Cladophialophora carrionii]|uniref:Uncharacterized protein n=1 Tax=Cladophialophora carrionii TaxID=86049 RepID=A0A1C1CKX2_9EURO|nr:hypothetical protein CLCR_05167 [Cladophialophora carrionii]